jgi:peptidyl-prolyl cis-trans isomerase B (cyclophilin B)
MRRTLTILAALLILGCGGNKARTQEPSTPPPSDQTPEATDETAPAGGPAEAAAPAEKPLEAVTAKLTEDSLPKEIYLTFDIKDFGKIVVQLFAKDAPKSVTNIVNLAVDGFYNGLTFHRIVPGFVVQGGDPDGTGGGGPGYTVPAEIKKKHDKGCMAMARKPDQVNPKKESSGSQFYFCLEALPDLDGEYTVIGQITEGMDVLEKLGQVKTGKKDKPIDPPVMTSVTAAAR